MTPRTFSESQIKLMIFIMLGFYPLIGMGVDLITPSLPAMTVGLNVSSTLIKNVVTVYLLGYAVGNFLSGLLSDSWGRKNLLVLGFVIFTLASLLPIFTPHPAILLFARALQGVGLGAFAVLTRGLFSDVLSAERLMRIAPFLSLAWGIGPVIGPVIGGYLQFYFDWQACFYFYAGAGLLAVLITLTCIPETHFKRLPLNPQQIGRNFKEIVTHKVFMGSILIMGCVYPLLIVFNTLGPFLIQRTLGHSPVFFGHIALWMGLMFVLGTLFCRRLIKKIPPEGVLRSVLPLAFLLGILTLGAAYVWGQSLWVIVLPSLLMFFITGTLYPTAMGKGLSLFRHLAGSAGAMMNLVTILLVCAVSGLMSLVSAKSMLPLAGANLGLIVLAGLSYWALIHKQQ